MVGQLDETQAKEIFRQIIETLDFCHENNICHRDLKPENIMFVDTTSNQIKLIDFGISEVYSQ